MQPNFDIPPGAIPGFPNAAGQMPPEEPLAPGDERLYVQFYMGAMKDDEASTEQGHPVFRSVPFIKIMVPGDKNTVVDAPADLQYQRRFSKLWRAFQANESQEIVGLPLKEWPAITRSQVEELHYMNVRTVEQLAGLADTYAQRIMGFHELKRKAEVYIQHSKDSALAMKMSAENEELKAQLKATNDELAKLSARFEEMTQNRTPRK